MREDGIFLRSHLINLQVQLVLPWGTSLLTNTDSIVKILVDLVTEFALYLERNGSC